MEVTLINNCELYKMSGLNLHQGPLHSKDSSARLCRLYLFRKLNKVFSVKLRSVPKNVWTGYICNCCTILVGLDNSPEGHRPKERGDL